MKRSSGIIMPVSSLPSPHGIGTMGKAAREWVDWLVEADQAWWQVLPLGPTSYGDSPYQSPSTFAGNPYLIDLDDLVERGLLAPDEVEGPDWGSDPAHVDYGALYTHRFDLLARACERGWDRDHAEIVQFAQANASWLDDYALFMAVKRHFGMVSWTDWPDEGIRMHRAEAITRYTAELEDDIRLFTYIQYLFFGQWEALRAYAHDHGIGIIGDLPIYMALDSADVWADPRSFQLDEQNLPVRVAGCPPDAFTADGQLWGNPLYDYAAMEQDGFAWWKRRLAGAGRLYDVIRMDHFRGFESYWSVPAGETTAKNGRWVPGPGMRLIGALKEAFPELQFIAEDLGYVTPEVAQLLADSGFPGMKVVEFAFDSRDDADYWPYHYTTNSVCYTGTHDNAPIMGWKDDILPEDLSDCLDYVGLDSTDGLNWALIRCGMGSVSDLFIAPMTDYLGLGAEARINTPGIMGGNWQWRIAPGAATTELAERIARLTKLYGRSVRH